jgi:hypothetical protein
MRTSDASLFAFNYELYEKCLKQAIYLVDNDLSIGKVGVDQLADTLYKLEKEKQEKNAITDQQLDYNDEIVAIEEIEEELETIDISVSGDNLFYCNGILTKNSFGLPATADLMLALITNEELEQSGQVMVKQLKNRYNDPGKYKRFVLGIDRSKMRLFDVDVTEQNLVDDGIPVFDKTPSGEKFKDWKI